jgi:hypothetical protein
MLKVIELSHDFWGVEMRQISFSSIEALEAYENIQFVCHTNDNRPRSSTSQPDYSRFHFEKTFSNDDRVQESRKTTETFKKEVSSSKGFFIEWEILGFMSNVFLWYVEFNGTVEDYVLLSTIDSIKNLRYFESGGELLLNASVFRQIVQQQKVA